MHPMASEGKEFNKHIVLSNFYALKVRIWTCALYKGDLSGLMIGVAESNPQRYGKVAAM